MVVTPARTTSYRIEASGTADRPATKVTSQVLLVRVGHKVRLAKPTEPDILPGRCAEAERDDRPRSREYLSYRPTVSGTYYVQVRASAPGATAYRLRIVKG